MQKALGLTAVLTRIHLSSSDWLGPNLHIGCKLCDSIVESCKFGTKSSHPGQVLGLLMLLPQIIGMPAGAISIPLFATQT